MKLPQTLLLASALLLAPKLEARERISVGIGVSSYVGPGCVPLGLRCSPFGGYGTYYQRRFHPVFPIYPAPVYFPQAPVRYCPPTVIYQSAPESVIGYRTPPAENRVIQVQAALRQRKYYSGAIDGLLGPGTQAAIRAYQVDRNLPMTGRLDPELISDLGL